MGTEIAYGATAIDTEIAYGATAMGTEIAYGATAMGTEIAYGALRRRWHCSGGPHSGYEATICDADTTMLILPYAMMILPCSY
eukprot:3941262-Rhodomonas_salina.1